MRGNDRLAALSFITYNRMIETTGYDARSFAVWPAVVSIN